MPTADVTIPIFSTHAHHRVRIDLDSEIDEELVIDTVPGLIAPLGRELQRLAPRSHLVHQGSRMVVVRFTGPLRALVPLTLGRSIGVALGRADSPLDERVRRYSSSLETGTLRALRTPAGDPLPVRVDPSIGPAFASVISGQAGWSTTSHAWSVNVTEFDGRVCAQVGALHRASRLGRLRSMTSSLSPVVAAYVVRLASLHLAEIVLDPFCGAGTLLVEAARLMRPGRVLGGDDDQHALALASRNLDPRTATALQPRPSVPHALRQWDARALPLEDASVDRIVSNLPYGKRVGRHRLNQELYHGALAEMRRVLRPDGVLALVTEHKKALRAAIAAVPELRLVRERVIDTGRVQPSVFVLQVRDSGGGRRAGTKAPSHSSARRQHDDDEAARNR